eukprot:m.274304 g.274304  ORF g.274304 m.274304 type:complete len:262 (+) comp17685_c0_seq5:526-1311(+)
MKHCSSILSSKQIADVRYVQAVNRNPNACRRGVPIDVQVVSTDNSHHSVCFAGFAQAQQLELPATLSRVAIIVKPTRWQRLRSFWSKRAQTVRHQVTDAESAKGRCCIPIDSGKLRGLVEITWRAACVENEPQAGQPSLQQPVEAANVSSAQLLNSQNQPSPTATAGMSDKEDLADSTMLCSSSQAFQSPLLSRTPMHDLTDAMEATDSASEALSQLSQLLPAQAVTLSETADSSLASKAEVAASFLDQQQGTLFCCVVVA